MEIPNSVEYIGEECFSHSGVEEITLPGTLKGIGKDAFDCYNLRTVWVVEGCTLDIRKYVSNSVRVNQK